MMNSLVRLRREGALSDSLLFLAHPPTVALGLRDRDQKRLRDLLVPRSRLEREGIAVTRSVRGGGITYHWPGQVACYPIVRLDPDERDVPLYMHKLEEVGIRTLQRFGLTVHRRRDSAAHVGLWSGNRKLISTGVRISGWVTSFGFAVNLDGDPSPSRYIRPCGLEGVRLATLEDILPGEVPPREELISALAEEFGRVFNRKVAFVPAEVIDRIWALPCPMPETVRDRR